MTSAIEIFVKHALQFKFEPEGELPKKEEIEEALNGVMKWVLDAMDEYAKQEQDKFKPLYIAAGNLLHLHICELEGIGSGMPTQKQWLKAVNELEKELGLNDKK